MGVRYPQLPPFVWQTNRFWIGLSGAIGSGKSAARQDFQANGCFVLDADQIAHQVLNSSALRPGLLELCGPAIVADDHSIRRDVIAASVFSDPAKLARLNQLVHPAVQKQVASRWSLQPAGTIGVYDVPLLFENGMQDQFDLTVVIHAARSLRMGRVQARSGWSESEFEARERRQIPIEQKIVLADLVIDNEAARSDLQLAIQTVCKCIRAATPRITFS
ncbi:MAG: dephospho-CoA kinase [Leptospiraceae bacterium]|nr:dephospho-CoA kinase [Leptospiraceae bacterium]